MFDGAPGHPVALGSAYFDDIAALEGDVGAREVLKRIGAFPIECGHLCSGIDIDTPEALEDLRLTPWTGVHDRRGPVRAPARARRSTERSRGRRVFAHRSRMQRSRRYARSGTRVRPR